MRQILNGKTLMPISLVIAIIPVILWLFEIRAHCDILRIDVDQLRQERLYIRQRIDQINDSIGKIEVSLGVIEHEIRTRK